MDNPAAFPAPGDMGRVHTGMTLRDWFAGQALAGMCVSDSDQLRALVELAKQDGCTVSYIMAQVSYERADTMLLARQQEKG